MPGLETWVYSQPCARARRGGDVYYLSSCASGRITRILLADVSGHGEAVAGIATGLRDLMRRNINLINQARFVQEMNRQFSDMADQGGFATALVCSHFAPTHSLQICSAGHPSPLVYQCASDEWTMLAEADVQHGRITDTPLGVVDHADYSRTQIWLEPGDMVLAFSDAFIESVDGDNQQLGLEGLLRLVQGIDPVRPQTVIPQLVQTLRRCQGVNLERDDVTAILLRATAERTALRDNLLSPLRMLRPAADHTRLDLAEED